MPPATSADALAVWEGWRTTDYNPTAGKLQRSFPPYGLGKTFGSGKAGWPACCDRGMDFSPSKQVRGARRGLKSVPRDAMRKLFLTYPLRMPLPSLRPKPLADLAEDFHQQINFRRRVVEIETGPRTGRDSQPVVQWPRAMMPGPCGNPLLVEQLSDIVGVRLGQREAHQ